MQKFIDNICKEKVDFRFAHDHLNVKCMLACFEVIHT
jgi:hypothetical protein